MKASLKETLRYALEAAGLQAFGAWLLAWPAQCLLACTSINWCRDIHDIYQVCAGAAAAAAATQCLGLCSLCSVQPATNPPRRADRAHTQAQPCGSYPPHCHLLTHMAVLLPQGRCAVRHAAAAPGGHAPDPDPDGGGSAAGRLADAAAAGAHGEHDHHQGARRAPTCWLGARWWTHTCGGTLALHPWRSGLNRSGSAIMSAYVRLLELPMGYCTMTCVGGPGCRCITTR